MADAKRKRPVGWVLPAVLLVLGIYVIFKLQGWAYARQAQHLQRQLDGLRPALSAKVAQEQAELLRDRYRQALGQLGQADVRGGWLLQEISKNLPVSITLERIERRTPRSLRAQGTCVPGIRPPEAVLVLWAQKLRREGLHVRIHRLVPSARGSGMWTFEVQVEDA